MQEKFLIPLSLVISSIILGAGIYFTHLSSQKKPVKIIQKDISVAMKIPKVDLEKDHIQGSKTADFFIIEYSDLECVGCKVFSKLKNQLVKKYADEENVAFVYRHFPLYKGIGNSEPRHPTAGIESRALECVAKLTNEENFFKMKKRIFDTTKSDGHYPVRNLSVLAAEFGIEKEIFNNCIDSREIKEKIEKAWQTAFDAGINATPAVFIQIKSAGKTFEAIPGKDILDKAIQSYLQNN